MKLHDAWFHAKNMQDGEEEKHEVDFDVSNTSLAVFPVSLQETQAQVNGMKVFMLSNVFNDFYARIFCLP